MTIVWNISQLDRQTSDGFVTTAHWQATAVDGEHSASIVNTCSCLLEMALPSLKAMTSFVLRLLPKSHQPMSLVPTQTVHSVCLVC